MSFGEIIYDEIDGDYTLGGAPLNFSYHLSSLGEKGAILSAVGHDELGKKAIEAITSYGIDCSLINYSTEETGKAHITRKGSENSYSFNFPAAWDRIKMPQKLDDVDLIYFGTLASRSESRKTLFTLLDTVKAKEVFFDVNLRLNFYDEEIIKKGLETATILKLNNKEAPIVLSMLNLSGQKGLEEIKRRYNIKVILVTYGKNGSYAYDGKWCCFKPEFVTEVDSTGAGDSYSAGFISTYFRTKDTFLSMQVATAISQEVVTKRGAINPYSESLKEYLREVKKL